MKHILILVIAVLLLSSCSDDDDAVPTVTTSTVSFKLTGLEPFGARYQDTLIEVIDEIKYNWNSNYNVGTDSVAMVKSASFHFNNTSASRLNYCEQLVIKLEKREAKSNLVYDTYFQRWKYKSLAEERQLFYQAFDTAYLEINLCYLQSSISLSRSNENFRISEFKKVLVNGEEAWAIKASFRGTTYNKYHYEGDVAYFDIQEGQFEGVLN